MRYYCFLLLCVISMPLCAQTPFPVNIPAASFSVKWEGVTGKVEDIAGGRRFRGNGGTRLVLQGAFQMHPSPSADHKIQRLVVHYRADRYGPTLQSVKLFNGSSLAFQMGPRIQGDFTRVATAYNAWIWREPMTVSPQTFVRLEIGFPTGFEGPGSLVDFILTGVEVDYPLKRLVSSTTVNSPSLSTLIVADLPAGTRKPVTQQDKDSYAAIGAEIAATDPMVAAFRDLEPAGPRQTGFDMGIGITDKDKLWGPGKQWFLNSLSAGQQMGFKDGAAFALGRNNNPDLAALGMGIAAADTELAEARAIRPSGLYWLGFDIATGIFGNPDLGALGYTTINPRDERMRASASEGEHILLLTHEVESGFNASMVLHLARKYK